MNSMLDMDVHGNKLTGSVPEELGYLSNMIYLDLYDNRFTGSFPETFGKLLMNLFVVKRIHDRLYPRLPFLN